MNWKKYQQIFELAAVVVMIAGILLMNQHSDPQHFVIYFGFVLLATGKLIEAFNVHDPSFKIVKISLCISMYVLAFLNIFYAVKSILYFAIPLGLYYLLHYRLMFQQRKT
ncbi:MAG TPA: hypothetical protein PLR06_12745 [Cyclobacteriaceae bacterium]|nr:hypothetical protein [Cyclobacteriaceae bacterium]